MDENQRKQIKEIIDGLRCSKDFVCYTSGQKMLCKAEDIGLDSYLVCLEKNPKECKFFAVVFGANILSMSAAIYI
jgi:hypothetical protein